MTRNLTAAELAALARAGVTEEALKARGSGQVGELGVRITHPEHATCVCRADCRLQQPSPASLHASPSASEQQASLRTSLRGSFRTSPLPPIESQGPTHTTQAHAPTAAGKVRCRSHVVRPTAGRECFEVGCEVAVLLDEFLDLPVGRPGGVRELLERVRCSTVVCCECVKPCSDRYMCHVWTIAQFLMEVKFLSMKSMPLSERNTR